jgi:hypothetical protein
MRLFALLAVTGTALLTVSNADAALVTYTSRAAFLAAITPTYDLTFDGLAPPGGYTIVQGQTLGGITFSNTSGSLGVIDPGYAPAYYQWGSAQSLLGYYYGDPTTGVLPVDTTAVGADVMVAEYLQGGIPYTLTAEVSLKDGSIHTLVVTTLSPPSRAFVGFTSDISIASIAFYTPDDSAIGLYPLPIVDNVVYQARTKCVTLQRGQLGAVADAHLASDKPGVNFGSSQSLTSGQLPAGSREALLRFDTSVIPSGKFVTTATATLSVLLNGGVPVNAHQATAPWSETAVTYGSFGGAFLPQIEATFPAASTTTADLTRLAQGWVDGTIANDGVLLESGGTTATVFASSEQAQALRPKLDVCYLP